MSNILVFGSVLMSGGKDDEIAIYSELKKADIAVDQRIQFRLL